MVPEPVEGLNHRKLNFLVSPFFLFKFFFICDNINQSLQGNLLKRRVEKLHSTDPLNLTVNTGVGSNTELII